MPLQVSLTICQLICASLLPHPLLVHRCSGHVETIRGGWTVLTSGRVPPSSLFGAGIGNLFERFKMICVEIQGNRKKKKKKKNSEETWTAIFVSLFLL